MRSAFSITSVAALTPKSSAATRPRLAIIDLGTNTFHLLVIEASDRQWHTLYKERVFVNLAESGIQHIGDAPWRRGLSTMVHFKEMMTQHRVEESKAVGTAALRSADNARAFIDMVREVTGIQVEIISGDEEARLIALGVQAAIPTTDTAQLIMDIGGGSVEFILVVQGSTVLSKSYPVGVAVLYERFHHSEPISAQELRSLDRFLAKSMDDLLEVLKSHPRCVLVGASGTFEVVDRILHPSEEDSEYSSFAHVQFDDIYRQIAGLDLPRRLAHPDIPDSRARYIVVAVHLIAFVLEKLQGPDALISNYAMKEGLAVQWLRNLGISKY